MTSNEIRAESKALLGRLSRTDRPMGEIALCQAQFTAELAAQLAELNEKLVDLIVLYGSRELNELK